MDTNVISDETVRVVIVGHVDHGKSTLIGRLMYDLNQTPDGKYEELKKVCDKRGMTFEWAFLMDALQTERNQGITIDTSQVFFKTKNRNYVFIDAPGHREFLRNMITGASSADVAILIIDADEGIKGQTKKHAYLLKILGISEVLVLINKMDIINYNKKRFLTIKKEINNFLNLISVKSKIVIPISARNGENINNKSQKMSWYDDLNLVESLDSFNIKNESSHLPLRLPIQDIYKFSEKRIIIGKIESGSIKLGDQVVVSPSNAKAKVNSFEVWPKTNREEFYSGECVSLTLDEKIFIERGDMISHSKNLPQLTNIFEANIFWLSKKNLDCDKIYSIKLNSAEHKITFKKIIGVINTEDLSRKKDNTVEKNDVAEVLIHSKSLISTDNFKENPTIGRFSVIDDYEIGGGGIINIENYPNQRINKTIKEKNILPIKSLITEAERTSRSLHRPGIIWFTGLSGSGKSTIAKKIERKLFIKGYNVYTLDGDNLRNGLNQDLTFSPEDRMENIRRTAEVATLFSYAGYLVITSLISPYKTERQKARDIRPEIFKEIYIKASIDECIKRDVKGLYARAIDGKIENFTGLTSPYEEPEDPDLILDTEKNSIDQVLKKLEVFIEKEFKIIKN